MTAFKSFVVIRCKLKISFFQDERAFRIQRALHYSMLKTILPKEDWVTYEEDQVNPDNNFSLRSLFSSHQSLKMYVQKPKQARGPCN